MNLVKKSTLLLATAGAFCITSCGPKAMDYKKALEWVEKNYQTLEEKEVSKVNYEWNYTANVKRDVIEGIPTVGDVDINVLVAYAIQGELKITFEDDELKAQKGSRENVDYTGGLWDYKKNFDKDTFADVYNHEGESKDVKQEFTVNGKKLTAKEKASKTETTMLGDVTFVETDIRILDDLGYTYSIEVQMEQKGITLEYGGKTYNLGDLHGSYKTTVVTRA